MPGQLGFLDVEAGQAPLSDGGDPLEKLDAAVPRELFRKPLANALKRPDGLKAADHRYIIKLGPKPKELGVLKNLIKPKDGS